MPPAPTSPIRNPRPTPPTDPKSQKKKWLAITALLTSTPFLIAIAVHVLALLGLGSVVIFKGGNPLSIFTSENVDSADSGPESSAPPSTEDAPPEDSAPAMAETTPTEIDNSTEILALSTPTTAPTFAPPTPTKLSTPTTSLGQGSAGTGTKSGGGGSGGGKGRRTSKSTLFGFSEKMGGELEGTMYDLKLKADGKKPSGINDNNFAEAVSKIIANRFRPSVLKDYFRVDKKFYETSFFIPIGDAGEAPEVFGVKNKVKPNNFLIHYTGSFAAPEDGDYRFVGLGDDSIVVLVSGSIKLDATFSPLVSYTDRKHKEGPDGFDFFPIYKNDKLDESRRDWSKLREGDWIRLKAKAPMALDIVLIEQGDPKTENGGSFGFVLCIEKKGVEYQISKKGKISKPILPLFLLEQPDTNRQRIIRENKDKLEVDLKNAPIFGTAASAAPAEPEPTPTAASSISSSSANSDSASDLAYGSDWKNESTAGSGFGPWQLLTNADPNQKTFAGFYLAEEKEKPNITPVASNGRAWGLFANGDNFPKACAFRPLSQPLAPGQSLSLDILRSPFPEATAKGGSVGLTLRQGTTASSPDDYNKNSRFELCALQDKPTLQLFDGEKDSSTTFPNSTLALRISFLLKTSDTYDLKLEPLPLGQGAPVELKNRRLSGNAGSPIESLVLFNRNGQADSWCNNLQISTP